MDCRRYHDLLEARAEGRLPADRAGALDAHLAVCPTCRAELAFLQGELDAGDPDDILTAGILDRTVGSPCASAQERLVGWLEGELAGEDEELVAAHAERCDGCGRLAEQLRAIDSVLPHLAVLEPDASFVEEVLDRTLGPRERELRWWERWVEWGHRWTLRPRFALEAAYAMTVLVVLLTATPISPARSLPTRALDWLRSDAPPPLAAEAQQAVRAGADDVGSGLARLGKRVVGDLETRRTQAGLGLSRLDQHAGELGGALRARELQRIRPVLGEIRCDLKILWRGLRKKLDEEGALQCRAPRTSDGWAARSPGRLPEQIPDPMEADDGC